MPQILKPKSVKKSTKKKVKKTLVLVKTRSTKTKHSPVDYYNCLLNYAQTGFIDAEGKQKIHACCKKCKLSAPALNNQRDREIFKLVTAHKQVGDSLTNLLRPVK